MHTGLPCIKGSGGRKVRKLMSLVLDLLGFVVGAGLALLARTGSSEDKGAGGD